MTAHDAPASLGWKTAAALYACFTVAYTWPLLLALGTSLPNDTGDPGLLSFVLWWNSKTVPFTDAWWNLPSFYPAPGSLALSDTLLGMTPFTSPLIWLGASPVVAHNALFVVSIFTAALSAHALVRYLTGRHDAALLAGLAFGFSPYRASQMPHLQLLVTCWLALALFALHRYLERRRWTDLALFGLSWLMNALISGYYMVFLAVLLGFWMLWFARTIRDWVAIGASAVLWSLPLVPMIIGHDRFQKMYGLARSRDEIEGFSGDLSGFLSAPWHAWVPRHYTFEPRAEGELYPGLAVVALTLAGAVVAWRRWRGGTPIRARRWLAGASVLVFLLAVVSLVTGGASVSLAGLDLSFTRPYRVVTVGIWLAVAAVFCDRRWLEAWRRRSVLAFYGLAAVAMGVFALGPVGRVFGVRFLHMAPYAWLMELPGGDSLRVPARFAMLMALCLAVSAAVAYARLAPGGIRKGVLALLAALILIEGWVPKLPAAPTAPMVDLPGLEPGTAVLEVPSRDLWSDTTAMLRSTRHGFPTINGFSGYAPPHYLNIFFGLRDGDPSVIDTWREFGPVAVLVNARDDPERTHEAFVSQVPGALLTYRTPVGPVYRFPGRARRTNPAAVALPIAAMSADINPGAARAMTDGNLDTQWKSLGPQEPGRRLTVRLPRDYRIDRIEMDLGAAQFDYPRGLRIEARQSDGSSRTVWDSGTAGPAAVAVLEDRVRVPVRLPMPDDTVASEFELTLTGSDPEFYWTVAEFRVYGEPR